MGRTTVVGPKGRTVLPVAARREAGVEIGEELVVVEAAQGRITLATREAIEAEVWASSDSRVDARDAVAEVRQMRARDSTLAEISATRPAVVGSDDDAEEVGATLLGTLGLLS
ncbi:MAG: hypothetical protein M3024_10940 [Candidatus Dormibacteraeota bacterium]|nr:hypothetical protein [Candidatus Dormibacteraeota bacterium]